MGDNYGTAIAKSDSPHNVVSSDAQSTEYPDHDVDGNSLSAPAVDAEVETVLARVNELVDQGKDDEALGVLSDAIAVIGDRSPLFARAAELEKLRDHYEAALAYSLRAVEASPADPTVQASHAELLDEIGLTRQAMTFLGQLPKSVSGDSSVRMALANIYASCGWHALALQVAEPRSELSSASRMALRASWWRTGGPIEVFRKRALVLDQESRVTWEFFAQNLSVLDTLEKPQGFALAWVRGGVDRYLRRLAQLVTQWDYIGRWVRRFTVPVTIVLIWLAILIAMRFLYKDTGIGISIGMAAVSTLWAWLAWQILASIGRSMTRFRDSLLTTVFLVAFFVGLGILIIVTAPVTILVGVVGLGLIAAPCWGTCVFVFGGVADVARYLRINALRRELPREVAIDCLLDVVTEMSLSDNRNDLNFRRKWMQYLEVAAKHIEVDLPRVMSSGHPDTDRWVFERAKGAAAGLRRINRHIAASGAGTLDRVLSVLHVEVMALACGDFATLLWAPPPTPEAENKGWRKLTIVIIRTIFVMATPIAAVLLLQHFVTLEANVLDWAIAASLGWAILYLLVTIDPTLNEKITTARNLVGMVRETRFPQSPRSDDQQGQKVVKPE